MIGSILTTHEALSGTFGSISLAAWIFVLVPQLLENYQSGSADGISLAFLTVWCIGDLANFFGAIWAGLVPTVIALAVYFCIADTILIIQCLYYKNISRQKEVPHYTEVEDPTQPLLTQTSNAGAQPVSSKSSNPHITSLRSLFLQHFKGATRSWLRNTVGVAAVCGTGTLGWAIAWKVGAWEPTPETLDGSPTGDNIGASILGYTSAICYLSARIPQIMKNFREKSCEGLSLLFFILSLVGNLSYGAGILFHSISRQYLIINIPWLIGSLGTMGEDVLIFVQFHLYANKQDEIQSSAVT